MNQISKFHKNTILDFEKCIDRSILAEFLISDNDSNGAIEYKGLFETCKKLNNDTLDIGASAFRLRSF